MGFRCCIDIDIGRSVYLYLYNVDNNYAVNPAHHFTFNYMEDYYLHSNIRIFVTILIK